MLKAIAEIIRQLVGSEYLYFETPLQVKTTPHTHPVNLHGACASPEGLVYVMDADHEWHQLEQKDKDAVVIESLFQRVRFLKQQYSQPKEQEAKL